MTMNLPWDRRPPEIANLLNPAFCSVLLFDTVKQYQSEGFDGLPYPLSFLVLPIILHKNTRQSLPQTRATKMSVWLQDKSFLKIGFAKRARLTVPFTNEAIIYGVHGEVLSLSDEGLLMSGSSKISNPKKKTLDDEIYEYRMKAIFLGKWFSDVGSVATIYALWGIRP